MKRAELVLGRIDSYFPLLKIEMAAGLIDTSSDWADEPIEKSC